MSPRYRVRWEIDVEAGSPQEAAEEALGIQRDPDSIAVVFDLTDEQGRRVIVDLMKQECAPRI